MITIKLPYKSTDEFHTLLKELRRQQSCAIRSAYNKLKDGEKLKDVNGYLRKLNNIDKLTSWFLYSATNEAKTIFSKKSHSPIFGGKQNWIDYNKKKISKEQFRLTRICKLSIVGESLQDGNRHFEIDIENNKFIFKYKCKQHFDLTLPKIRKKYKEQLQFIQNQAESKKQPFSVFLDETYIYISFEPKKEQLQNLNTKRLMSVDLNPNEIGYSILEFNTQDEFKVVDSGIIDNSELNTHLKGLPSSDKKNKYKTNKRTFEIYNISKFLVEKAKHFQCSKFVMEDLTIGNKNFNKGNKYNRLINNNWQRTKLETNIKKRCEIYEIELVKANPSYSSFVGNLLYSKKYPDPICSAIEIGRRGYKIFVKGWFYPKLIAHKDLPKQWKQEVSNSYQSWRELFNESKKMELKYHFSWKDLKENFRVLSLTSPKSCVKIISRYNKLRES